MAVSLPMDHSMRFPYIGHVRANKPSAGSYMRLCTLFGISFYVTGLEKGDIKNHSIIIPAWQCKSTNRADVAFFEQKEMDVIVRLCVPELERKESEDCVFT